MIIGSLRIRAVLWTRCDIIVLADCLLNMLLLLFALHMYRWLLLKNCLLNLLRLIVPIMVVMFTLLFYELRCTTLLRHWVIGAVLSFIGRSIRNIWVRFCREVSALFVLRPIE